MFACQRQWLVCSSPCGATQFQQFANNFPWYYVLYSLVSSIPYWIFSTTKITRKQNDLSIYVVFREVTHYAERKIYKIRNHCLIVLRFYEFPIPFVPHTICNRLAAAVQPETVQINWFYLVSSRSTNRLKRRKTKKKTRSETYRWEFIPRRWQRLLFIFIHEWWRRVDLLRSVCCSDKGMRDIANSKWPHILHSAFLFSSPIRSLASSINIKY